MRLPQACDICGTPCGSLQKLICHGWRGKRVCDWCWKNGIEKRQEADFRAAGYVKLPWGGWRVPDSLSISKKL